MGNVVVDGRAQRSDTRGRILDAACDIAKAGDGTRVSVRAVAARAGVGLGTLRHHFPTQGELLNAVLTSIYQEALPDERIRDSSAPPKDRLLECLRHILAPVGVEGRAREVWAGLFRAFIDPAAADGRDVGYLALERQTLGRIESWLSILVDEGSLACGDNAFRARFLVTVLNGLAVQRALPSVTAPLDDVENAVLLTAVGALGELR